MNDVTKITVQLQTMSGTTTTAFELVKIHVDGQAVQAWAKSVDGRFDSHLTFHADEVQEAMELVNMDGNANE